MEHSLVNECINLTQSIIIECIRLMRDSFARYDKNACLKKRTEKLLEDQAKLSLKIENGTRTENDT